MADPRFFKNKGPIALQDIAESTGAKLLQEDAGSKKIIDVAPLDKASSDHLSFLDNKKYISDFETTQAGACFVHPELADRAPDGMICLISENPYKSYAIAAQSFYSNNSKGHYISSNAIIDKSATIGDNCYIDSGVVIGPNVKIGNNCHIHANAVIETSTQIGNNCDIGANSVLSHCLIGSSVCLYPGVKVGQAGFGFAIDNTGFTTVPQLGRVIIEDGVEIGANSTIDRGAGPDTVIGQGTRIDNLVQIGHNVKIGMNCVLVSQVGIAGSAEIGSFVMMGGQSAVAGHLKIGSGVRIAGQSGVIKNIPPGQKEYMGVPAVPIKQFMRQVVTLAKMVKTKNKTEK